MGLGPLLRRLATLTPLGPVGIPEQAAFAQKAKRQDPRDQQENCPCVTRWGVQCPEARTSGSEALHAHIPGMSLLVTDKSHCFSSSCWCKSDGRPGGSRAACGGPRPGGCGGSGTVAGSSTQAARRGGEGGAQGLMLHVGASPQSVWAQPHTQCPGLFSTEPCDLT